MVDTITIAMMTTEGVIESVTMGVVAMTTTRTDMDIMETVEGNVVAMATGVVTMEASTD